MRRRPTALMLVAIVSLATPAMASPSLDEAQRRGEEPRARWSAARARALDRLAPARGLADGAGVLEAVRAAAAVGGVRLADPPAAPARPEGPMPAGVAAPVSELLAAVERAGSVAGRPGGTRAARFAAAADLAAAIERVLPALPASGGHSSGAAGCDVADQPPVLCVGGTGANVIAGDYALVLDLGGDDVHRHAAGGADPQRNQLAASVTIDLAGNDRYESPVPAASGARAVQGAGVAGGIGVLVDAGGRDTYRAVSTAAGSPALGQGYGSSGVGVLADLGGDDDYLLEERTPGIPTSLTQRMPAAGQGFAEVGGVGIALDGAGDDVAIVRSAPPDAPTLAVRHAGGFGAGEQGGVGLHADLGGEDRFLLEALDGTSGTSYGASARGFGFGFEGAGVEVGGLGDTERIARVHNDVRNVEADNAAMFSLGAASLGGFGAIHDAGGDDRYVSDFATISESEHTVANGCECQGAGAAARAGGGQSLAIAAGQQGTAVIEDVSGDDAYETVSVTRARAVARDDRTQVAPDFVPASSEATVVAAGGGFAPAGGQVVAQGVGISNGYALLLDGAGNDRYHVDLRYESAAETTGPFHLPGRADEAEVPGPTASALGGELDVYMQAVGQLGGIGAIEDGAGDDRYEIDLVTRMTAKSEDRRDPASSAAYLVSARAAMSQGYHDIYGQGIGVVGGAGFLHDGLGDDLYRINHTLGATAEAIAGREDVQREATAETGLFARVEAMGAGGLGGYGELRDHGGTDAYACVARSTAQATPPTGVEDGNGQCQVLGGGVAFGFFADIEGGAADAITIDPPFPATTGTRGQGFWAGPGGAGVNA